jgi:putative addiction module component (TIGR02574 family)
VTAGRQNLSSAARDSPDASGPAFADSESISRYNLFMSRSAHEILEEARQLPPDEVNWLIESLLRDGDVPAEAEIEAAWDSEIKRRLDEIDSGAVQLIPVEQVLAEMDAWKLEALRSAVDEEDTSGIAGGDVFAQVRETLNLTTKSV